MGYSFQLTTRVLLYAPTHRQDSTYHSLCYTNRGALAGMSNSSKKDRSDNPSHHEQTLLPRSLFHLMRHSTHFIYGYMVSHLCLRTRDYKRGNPLQLPHRLLFLISSKGSFICIILGTYDTTYHWPLFPQMPGMRNSLMGQPGAVYRKEVNGFLNDALNTF